MKNEISNINDVEEKLRTIGSSSEFKNKYCVEILRHFAERYSKPFTCKYSTTPQRKGVVDRVGRNCKSIV